jgi:hypothetical protein
MHTGATKPLLLWLSLFKSISSAECLREKKIQREMAHGLGSSRTSDVCLNPYGRQSEYWMQTHTKCYQALSGHFFPHNNCMRSRRNLGQKKKVHVVLWLGLESNEQGLLRWLYIELPIGCRCAPVLPSLPNSFAPSPYPWQVSRISVKKKEVEELWLGLESNERCLLQSLDEI